MKRSRRRANGHAITTAMLGDTAALLTWRQSVLGRQPCEADVLLVLGAAERALEVKATNSPGLFRWLLDHPGHITQAQDDRAADRLRAYRRRQRVPNDFLRSMTAGMMAKLKVPTT